MAICATRIVAIMSTRAFQARKLLKQEKRSGTLLNASGREATRAAIIMDNGVVVASPVSVGRILKNIAMAGPKGVHAKREHLSTGVKLLDLIPDELENGEYKPSQEMFAQTEDSDGVELNEQDTTEDWDESDTVYGDEDDDEDEPLDEEYVLTDDDETEGGEQE